ncbi:autotransporter domain-containing protein [Mesorhizobium sp. M0938]|uniref:autotransporter outer membrane beta-barrel domain-containing protein n=1 Tax=unclassified Mesorhizobium TaxID=325217 RepID=UPI0033371B19
MAPKLTSSGNVTTYQGTESAGDTAITNNENDRVEFLDQSTAGQATVVNNSGGSAHFSDQSTAGSAFMTNNADSLIEFTDQSTAAGSNITSNEGGRISFDDDAGGGNAAIANNGSIAFQGNASAEQANIVSNAGATVSFSGNATAGTAQITNNGGLNFEGTSSAGQSLITNNEGAATSFSGMSSAATAAITNNGGVTFTDEATAGSASIINNQSGVVAFSGNASAGAAFMANSGQLEFAGSSSAGAAEIVNNASGILALSDSGTLANASVNNGGLLDFSGNASAGAATIVTGPAGRTVFRESSSGGTAALETNLGGTVDFSDVSDGQIEVGSIQGPGTYYLGGVALVVGGNNLSTTVDGAIVDGGLSGGTGGSLVKTGDGTLTLSGPNTYTGATDISGGVLKAGAAGALAAGSDFIVGANAMLDLAGFDQTIGSLSGTGSVDLATARLTAGGNDADTVFGGTTGGTGGLTKTGGGTMELAGVNTYSGTTEVEQGELRISGSIAASFVQVAVGAILSGNGTVGTTTVAGTLARETDGGTMTVDGDLVLGHGSTYSLALDPSGGANLLTVNGTATVEGSSLLVSAIGGFTIEGTSFRIISASQVIGNFSDVQSDMPFIDLALHYGDGTVDLDVSRNSAHFVSVADTANQRAVAGALAELPGGAILDAVVKSASTSAARSAFDALSGEIYPSLVNGLLESDAALREIMLVRARNSAAAYGSQTRSRLWFDPYLTEVSFSSNGNAASSHIRRSGFLTGGDLQLNENWLLGLAAGYGESDFDVSARASGAKVDTLSIGAYSAWAGSGLRGRFGGLYSWHEINSERNITFGAFRDKVEGKYNARSGQVFGEVDYPFNLARMEIAPFANLTYARWDANEWSESGGDAALDVQASHLDGLIATTGLHMGAEFPWSSDLLIRLGATAGWRFTSLNGSGEWHQLAGSSPFFIGGVPIERNAAVLGADLRVAFRSMSLGLAYDGLLERDSQYQSYKGFLMVKF